MKINIYMLKLNNIVLKGIFYKSGKKDSRKIEQDGLTKTLLQMIWLI